MKKNIGYLPDFREATNTIRKILEFHRVKRSKEAFTLYCNEVYGSRNENTIRMTLTTLVNYGLLKEVEDFTYRITALGVKWLEGENQKEDLVIILNSRVDFIGELLYELRGRRRNSEELLKTARDKYDIVIGKSDLTRRMQVLADCGIVNMNRHKEYGLTADGIKFCENHLRKEWKILEENSQKNSVYTDKVSFKSNADRPIKNNENKPLSMREDLANVIEKYGWEIKNITRGFDTATIEIQRCAVSAEDYEEFLRKIVPDYDTLYRQVIECLDVSDMKDLAWMDVSSKTGKMYEAAEREGLIRHFTFVNVSEKMLNSLKKKYGQSKKAAYRKIYSLDLAADGQYDVVTYVQAESCLSEGERHYLLEQCWKSLRLGGMLFIFDNTLARSENGKKLWKKQKEAICDQYKIVFGDLSQQQIPCPTTSEIYMEDMRKAGFSDVELIWKSRTLTGFLGVKIKAAANG